MGNIPVGKAVISLDDFLEAILSFLRKIFTNYTSIINGDLKITNR